MGSGCLRRFEKIDLEIKCSIFKFDFLEIKFLSDSARVIMEIIEVDFSKLSY